MRTNQLTKHVLIPMSTGGLIYILFREKSLIMFGWFHSLGLENHINQLRDRFSMFSEIVPGWFIYSLPDGIWIYSLTSLMFIIWSKNLNNSVYCWLLIGPFMGISAEVGQLLNFVPGTFDSIDLSFCLLASIVPFLVFNQRMVRVQP